MHSDRAERACISVALTEPHTIDVANLDSRDFFHLGRRGIWAHLCARRLEGKPIDDALIEAEIIEGDASLRPEWLACAGIVASPSLIESYADAVRKHAVTRRVCLTLSECLESAKRGEEDGEELLVMVQNKLGTIRSGAPNSTRTMAEMVKRLSVELDDLYRRRAEGEDVVRGIPTGFDGLDRWGGIRRGIGTILGARPGMGKSAVAQQITAAAIERGYGVHVFSIEDTEISYTSRAVSRESRVPLEDIQGAKLDRGSMSRLAPAMAKLAGWKNFLYEDVSEVTGAQVVAAARRHREENGTELVVVDYLQLMRRPDRKMDKQTAIDENLTVMCRAARADNMAYLILSQLNRQCESRPDKRPEKSDFRGAGEIEERGKAMISVYRPGYYDHDLVDDTVELDVIKNNDGPTGVIYANWDGRCTSATNRKTSEYDNDRGGSYR